MSLARPNLGSLRSFVELKDIGSRRRNLQILVVSFAFALFGTAPTRAYDDISGEWRMNNARMDLVHLDGETYEGKSKSNSGGSSLVRGQLEGQRFEGIYIVPIGQKACGREIDGSLYWGQVEWEFDAEFKRFSGHWTYCEEARPSGIWSGKRDNPQKDSEPLPARAASLLQAADDPKTDRCKGSGPFTLVLHGGAVTGRRGDHSLKTAFIRQLLLRNRKFLAEGAGAVDIVHGSIRLMEDSGLFNAGYGAIANKAGTIELDASIMEGRLRRAGAVAAVRGTKNPISAARLVMEQTKHVLLVGPEADAFVAANGGETVDENYFRYSGHVLGDVRLPEDIEIETPSEEVPPELAAFSGTWFGRWSGALNTILVVERVTSEGADIIYAEGIRPEWGFIFPKWIRVPATLEGGRLHVVFRNGHELHLYAGPADKDKLKVVLRNKTTGFKDQMIMNRRGEAAEGDNHGTVGAVALDRCGELAAGTSTGGYGSKTPGRVGDSPIIGAGTYADNGTAAISATGHGEYFIRYAVAHDVTARMRYKGESLEKAARQLIMYDLPKTGLTGGIIAVDRDGNVATPFNTTGMVRGAAGSAIEPWVEVY